MSGEPVAVLRRVYAGYGRLIVLQDVNIDIPEGLTLIIGPNGSGKSTLLKLLAGLLKPKKGAVKVLGFNPYRNVKLVSKLAMYVPERDTIPYNVSVSSVLESFRRLYDPSLVDELAEVLEITKHTGKRVGELSQGFRRRLALLEALASRRRLLLLDEPFRGLDSRSRRLVSQTIEEHIKRFQTTVILTTHIPTPMTVNKLLLVEDGRVKDVTNQTNNISTCYVILDCRGVKRITPYNPGDKHVEQREGCRVIDVLC